jgi:hypothetical protein
MRWVVHVAYMGKMKNAYSILVGNLKWRPCGEPRHIWKDNIKIDPKEVGCEDVDSFGS